MPREKPRCSDTHTYAQSLTHAADMYTHTIENPAVAMGHMGENPAVAKEATLDRLGRYGST